MILWSFSSGRHCAIKDNMLSEVYSKWLERKALGNKYIPSLSEKIRLSG